MHHSDANYCENEGIKQADGGISPKNPLKFEFSVYTDARHPVGKLFRLGADGEPEAVKRKKGEPYRQGVPAHFGSGKVQRVTAPNGLDGFAQYLEQLGANQAIGLGTCGREMAEIITTSDFDAGGHRGRYESDPRGYDGPITRTKGGKAGNVEFFKFNNGSNLVLVDVDQKWMRCSEALAGLLAVMPELEGCERLILGSSSSRVKRLGEPEDSDPKGGAHIYFVVTGGAEGVARFKAVLEWRLWKAGLGVFEPSKEGSDGSKPKNQPRTKLADMFIFTAERVIYETKPRVEGGRLVVHGRYHEYTPGKAFDPDCLEPGKSLEEMEAGVAAMQDELRVAMGIGAGRKPRPSRQKAPVYSISEAKRKNAGRGKGGGERLLEIKPGSLQAAIRDEFLAFCELNGFVAPPVVAVDGRWHRFKLPGGAAGNTDGAYVLHPLEGNGTYYEWRGGKRKPHFFEVSAETIDKFFPAEADKAARLERKAAYARAEEESADRLESQRQSLACYEAGRPFEPGEGHPYCEAKGGIEPYRLWRVSTLDTAQETVDPETGESVKVWGMLGHIAPGDILIPYRQPDGAWETLQAIGPDGVKKWPKNGGNRHGFHLLEGTAEGLELGMVLFCEGGGATAKSLWDVSGCPVYAAGGSANLGRLAAMVVEMHPDCRVIGCGDNGAGEREAMLAACSAAGAEVIFPPDGFHDFNDFVTAGGVVDFTLAGDADGAEFVLDCKDAGIFKVFLKQWGDGGRAMPPGVYWYGTKGKGKPNPRYYFISGPVLCTHRLEWFEGDGGHAVWLEFNGGGGSNGLVATPKMLSGRGDKLVDTLRERGLLIPQDCRELFVSFVSRLQPGAVRLAVDRMGWHGAAYVLPNQTIGGVQGDLVLASEIRTKIKQRGSLESWRSGVAAYCPGNLFMVCGVASGFAGAILHHCDGVGGAIHLWGGSSSGKSTAGIACCSVLGHGTGYKRSWWQTDCGLEGLAELHTDGTLYLDELTMMEPKALKQALYAFANGQGKGRMRDNTQLRETKEWCGFLLSSGEDTVEAHLASGGIKAKAGQLLRLLSIHAEGKHGAFDELHGFSDSLALLNAVTTAAAKDYGWPFIAFLEAYSAAVANGFEVRPQVEALTRELVGDGAAGCVVGQLYRAATVFAKVAVAGELATEYGITGWEPGTAKTAMVELYRRWLAEWQDEASDDRRILDAVQAVIDQEGLSRFAPIDHKDELIFEDRIRAKLLGWRKDVATTDVDGNTVSEREYWFNSKGFSEAISGFNHREAVRVLMAAGWLEAGGSGGKNSSSRRVEGTKRRVYVVKIPSL